MIAVCLLVAFAMPSATFAQGNSYHPGSYISFDPPGSTQTWPTAINAAGTVTGFYQGTVGFQGFVRDKMGNITSFDAPGASGTAPYGIRPNDDIVGYVFDYLSGVHGFVRDNQGEFTTFDVPGVDFTSAYSVNSSGDITGDACCIGSLEFPFNNLGYVRDHQGNITTFYGPTGNINPYSINASKAISGDYFIDVASFQLKCFLRSPDGDITDIVFPGSVSTFGCVLNSRGLIAGSYCDSTGGHGFLRDDKGAYTSFDAPGAVSDGECFGTLPTGINDAATIVGRYYDSQLGLHGFVRGRTGEMTTLDAPWAGIHDLQGTYPLAINDAGTVLGRYDGQDGRQHGFVWIPQ